MGIIPHKPAAFRSFFLKRIKKCSSIFSAHHYETPPPTSPPDVTYPSSVFLCFLYPSPSLPVYVYLKKKDLKKL